MTAIAASMVVCVNRTVIIMIAARGILSGDAVNAN
jgi:hypothetical protein